MIVISHIMSIFPNFSKNKEKKMIQDRNKIKIEHSTPSVVEYTK